MHRRKSPCWRNCRWPRSGPGCRGSELRLPPGVSPGWPVGRCISGHWDCRRSRRSSDAASSACSARTGRPRCEWPGDRSCWPNLRSSRSNCGRDSVGRADTGQGNPGGGRRRRCGNRFLARCQVRPAASAASAATRKATVHRGGSLRHRTRGVRGAGTRPDRAPCGRFAVGRPARSGGPAPAGAGQGGPDVARSRRNIAGEAARPRLHGERQYARVRLAGLGRTTAGHLHRPGDDA